VSGETGQQFTAMAAVRSFSAAVRSFTRERNL